MNNKITSEGRRELKIFPNKNKLRLRKSRAQSGKTIINHELTEEPVKFIFETHFQDGESALVHNRGLKCFIQGQLDTVSSPGSEAIPGEFLPTLFLTFFRDKSLKLLSCIRMDGRERIVKISLKKRLEWASSKLRAMVTT